MADKKGVIMYYDILEQLEDFKAISEIMGHSNIAITQNIYNHPTEQTKSNIVNSVFEHKIEEKKETKSTPNYNDEIKAIQRKSLYRKLNRIGDEI